MWKTPLKIPSDNEFMGGGVLELLWLWVSLIPLGPGQELDDPLTLSRISSRLGGEGERLAGIVFL